MFDFKTMKSLDNATKYVLKYLRSNYDEINGACVMLSINDINYVFYKLMMESIQFPIKVDPE